MYWPADKSLAIPGGTIYNYRDLSSATIYFIHSSAPTNPTCMCVYLIQTREDYWKIIIMKPLRHTMSHALLSHELLWGAYISISYILTTFWYKYI